MKISENMTTYSLNKSNYFLFPDSAFEVAAHALNTNLATSNGIYKRNTAQFGLLLFENEVNNNIKYSNSSNAGKFYSVCYSVCYWYTKANLSVSAAFSIMVPIRNRYSK